MTHHCSNCGQSARKVRGNYLFRESGLKNVVLKNIEIVRCAHCGNEDPIIAKMNELLRVLAIAVVGKPFGLTGEEVRFLRKYLQMSGDTFASWLHTDKTTVSKWENDQIKIGAQSDRLIRAIVLGMGSGLRPEVEHGVRNFPNIADKAEAVGVELNPADLSFAYAAS
jgi:YgiT-type zinc finger domain-containing protein